MKFLNISKKGETNYSLTGIIDIPWSASRRVEKTFYILDVFDLNDKNIASYRNGRDTRSVKIYGLCCCKTSPLKIEFGTIGRLAFIPGDTINLHIQLTNLSGRRLKSMQAILHRTITYNLVKEKINKKFHKQLAKWDYKFESDLGEEVFRFDEGKIQVPDTCLPSQEYESRLIKIVYDLRLFVFSTFFTMRSTTILPIKIGNVALREQSSTENNNEVSSQSTPENGEQLARPYYDINTLDKAFLKKLVKV